MDQEARQALEMTREELHRRAQTGRPVPVLKAPPTPSAYVIRTASTAGVVIEHSIMQTPTIRASDAEITID